MTLVRFPSRTAVMDAPAPVLVRPARDARWYDADGVPQLRVPYADPKRRGEYRSTTLADAKKLGLYPSTTNVLSVIDEPEIHAWQASQYIKAAFDLQRGEGEDLEAYAARVVESGEAYRNQARDEGQELHQAIADFMQGRDAYAYRGNWAAHLRLFAAWWEASGMRCLSAEHRFVNHQHGYGGMVDCLATDAADPERPEDLLIIDWKTQATEPGRPVRFYKKWAMQLAAYAHTPGIRLMNVVISRTEPGRIEWREWGDQELHWARFHAALCLWKLLSDYYPGEAA